MPALQVGGTQDAVTTPPAGCTAVSEPTLVTETEAGVEAIQVSGGLVSVTPCVSTTVAVIATDAPFCRVTELLLCPVMESVMDCTAHVLNDTGVLEAPPAVAKIWTSPGALAVACTCVGDSPLAEEFRVTTPAAPMELHVIGPTVEVMSAPLLRAVA
jgi:hypothetical protein